ncbi:MAG TPA: hypothetical protein PKG49_12040 [Nitrosomonas mobilis]|nr:hypothetical protein [Nitrosomonas mobilis]
MTDSNIFKLNKPEQNDLLQEVLREGARKMLAAAIEAKLSIFIEQQREKGKLPYIILSYWFPRCVMRCGIPANTALLSPGFSQPLLHFELACGTSSISD